MSNWYPAQRDLGPEKLNLNKRYCPYHSGKALVPWVLKQLSHIILLRVLKSIEFEKCKYQKTRWGSPVDNRHSTNKFHHFVRKRKKTKIVTCDMGHMTHDT